MKNMDPAVEETLKKSKDEPFVRICKQCGKAMEKPLEIGELLYMFCSAKCHKRWDQAREYRVQSEKRRSWDD